MTREEVAKHVFARNPQVKELFITSDNQPFDEEHKARNQSKRLKDQSVEKFTRAEKEVAETDEAAAEQKAKEEAEAAEKAAAEQKAKEEAEAAEKAAAEQKAKEEAEAAPTKEKSNKKSK